MSLIENRLGAKMNMGKLIKQHKIRIMQSKKHLTGRLKRGLKFGSACAAVTFVILILFRGNLTLGAITATLAVILIYFVLGRFF